MPLAPGLRFFPVAPFFALVRPLNLALAASAILLGARFAHASAAAWRAHAVVTAAAIALLAAGYAWNDAADVARDRVTHPRRPLPSGLLSPHAARVAALALFALGASLAIALGAPGASGALAAASVPLAPRALLLAWAALLLEYRAIADRLPSAKNALAGALTASALLLGGLLGPAPGRALFPALFAFLLTWVRETVKDLADRDGDRAVGRPSWIGSLPATRARRVVRAGIALLLALIPLPAIVLGYGLAYLALAAGGVGTVLVLLYRELADISGPGDAALAAAPASTAQPARPAPDLRRAARLLKGSMAMGLIALFAGGIG